jgi:hypothetical protein
MNDDIIRRLRATNEQSAILLRLLLNDIASLTEAADEIELLRRTIIELKGPEMCDPKDPCEMCKGSQ